MNMNSGTADIQVPEELLQEASGKYLAVHLHPQGVQMAIFDPDEGRFNWVREADAEIIHQAPFEDTMRLLSQCSWTRQVFRNVTVSFDTPDFTLVPTGLVLQGKESELLTFHASAGSHDVRSVALPESGITVVFDLPAAVNEIGRMLPGARIFPSSSLFLRYVTGHHDRHTNEMHLLLEPGYMLLTVMTAGKHQLTNHYDVQSEEDVLYFLAHAGIRLGIDLEHTHLRVYGKSFTPSLHRLLSDYFRHIFEWQAPAGFRLPDGVDACRHFATLIHPICAS
jgi:hypothetical protein